MKNQELVRLNVLLQKYGVASRRKADELIQSGAVRVDRKVVNTLGTKVNPTAAISIEGQQLNHIPEEATYLLHKPAQTITSRKDLQGRITIYDLSEVKKMEANVQAVGRLDYRSEGLLVMTNDGDLAFALSHPNHSVEKTYNVLLSTSINPEEVDKLRRGIQLEDGLAKPMSVKLGQKEKLGQSTGQWVELVVTEGRNRLIRRMMEALGLHVLRLARTAIGDLRLPFQLKPGSARIVTQVEKNYLDSLKKDALAQKESSQKKSKVTTKKIVRKKVSLNDKDYQKHVQTRSIINERIAKVRKSKLEEKILSKVKGQKKDEIQIEAKAGKTVRTAKKTDSKKPRVIQKSKLKTNVDRKPQNKKVAEKPSIKSKARTNSKSSVRAHSKPKKKSR
jgi:pseudouridine synthase